ncbi:MAG: hypothetical protein J7L31_00265 [Thermoplasmata archaeon]|nr:hypothetical protein [Thermoplasmata archaeon]
MPVENVKETLDEILHDYIPSSISTPSEKALYEPDTFYGLPQKKADEYRYGAIKYAFRHHYENNRFYREVCRENGVTPDDIRSIDDFSRIPLITHKFFKDYPSGRDFAVWLANLMSTEVPKVVIKGKNPSFDDVIDAFAEAGVVVAFSSGTTGKFTFIPRDAWTYKMGQYAIGRSAIEMLKHWYEPDASGFLLFPNPKKTNIYVGKVTNVMYDLVKDVQVAIDREITTQILRISMGVTFNFKEKMMSKMIKAASKKMNEDMVKRMVNWIDEMYKKGERILFAGAPFILNMALDRLEEEGKSYDFGERGAVLTGGGWKIHEDKRLPVEVFRERVGKILGIPPENCLDLYAMVESNGFLVHCPEGHYFHIPQNYFHVRVIDDDGEDVAYGEEGRFAFLDGIAMSYPGFISTGDKVKIHERCPACGREGPVLEPEVERIKGEEIRGCAEEMRRIIMEE